ncbi:MAG: PD40 domain-containing protein [Gemmatimonadetes bacterium]|nr:PD40 domain-containing protein [Gemmatimonadota bacterium]
MIDVRVFRRCATLLAVVSSVATAQPGAGRVFNPRVNPVFPKGDIVAYEQLDADRRELQFLRLSTGERFPARKDAVVGAFSLPGAAGDARVTVYSGDLDWRPTAVAGRYWFAYIAGDDRGLHLYFNFIDAQGKLATTDPIEVPFPGAVRSPRWSADGRHLAFVSDSSALHVLWNVDRALASPRGRIPLRAVPIASAARPALFPSWSAIDVRTGTMYLAYQVEKTIRGNRVYAIDALTVDTKDAIIRGGPVTLTEALQGANAYRPSWSPDGRMIAFYTDRGRTGDVEAQRLDIRVAEVQKSRDGALFRGELLQGRSPRIAEGVLPVEYRGPEWTKIGVGTIAQPAIVYVQRDEAQNNPIAVVAIDPWRSMRSRSESEVVYSARWGTANHKEVNAVEGCREIRYTYVSVAGGGEIVRSQIVNDPMAKGPCSAVPSAKGSGTTIKRPSIALSALFPGGGQLSSGRTGKGVLMAIGGLGGAAIGFVGASGTKSAADAALSAITSRDSSAWASASDDHASKKSLATIGIGVAAAGWLFSVLDAALAKGGGESASLSVGVLPSVATAGFPGGRALPRARFGVRLPFGGPGR